MTNEAPSARAVLDMLARQNLVDAAQASRAEELAQQHRRLPEMPLPLRILVGVGAFFSTICIIGFLAAAEIINIDKEAGLLVWGVIFGVAAIFLYAQSAAEAAYSLRHSFVLQASFCAMAVGKSLFVFGIAVLADSPWGVTWGALIVTILTYPVYPLSLDRFLSVSGVLFSLLFNLLLEERAPQVREFLLHLLFAAQLLAASWLFTSPRAPRLLLPAAYAVVAALIGMVTLLALLHSSEWRLWEFGWRYPAVPNALLCLGLLWLIPWAAGGWDELRREAVQAAIAGALLLGLISAPGVILSAALLILGYARHARLLLWSGLLLLPLYLFIYYYSLHLSLLAKSGVLIGSGAVLLAGYFYLRWRGHERVGIGEAG
jgi:hypothetical protein